MDDSYRISSSARAADPLVQALRHSTAPPAVRRRPAPVGERSSVTVDAYGADPTGQKDSIAAFRAALRAAGAGGVVSLPGGSVYALSDTVLVSQPVAIDCRATIRPFSGPKRQVPFFNISGVDGASFDGHGGACVFDGVSSAFANFTTAITLWDASNVSVAGIHVVRLAVNQTSASNPLGAVVLSAASGCVVRDSIIEDSGVAHSYHIGFGIYLVYSTDCNITNNTVRAVGSTGINDSGGLRNRFTANHLIKIGLFSFVSAATAAHLSTRADATVAANRREATGCSPWPMRRRARSSSASATASARARRFRKENTSTSSIQATTWRDWSRTACRSQAGSCGW